MPVSHFGEPSCHMRIRDIRKSRGITQAQLGSRIGLPQCEISRIECGRRTLSVPRLCSIAAALEVPEPRLTVPQRAAEWSEAALSRLEPYSPAVGRVAHGLRAWLADHVYDTGRYEARYGPLVRSDWRVVLQDEARWLTGQPSNA